MKPGLLVMGGIAAAAGSAGLTLLARPGAARRLLRLGEGPETTYALRIIGAMLFALGLFLGGFAAVFGLLGGSAA